MTGWLSDGAHAGDRYLSTGAKNDIALPQVAGFVHYLVQSNTRKMKKALIIKGLFHSLAERVPANLAFFQVSQHLTEHPKTLVNTMLQQI